ncbi:MAG: hypothetical protein ACREUQ_06490, partial [Burkholderiales bacterium]
SLTCGQPPLRKIRQSLSAEIRLPRIQWPTQVRCDSNMQMWPATVTLRAGVPPDIHRLSSGRTSGFSPITPCNI